MRPAAVSAPGTAASPSAIQSGRATDHPPSRTAVPPPPERVSSHAPAGSPSRSRMMVMGVAGAAALLALGGGGLAAAVWWMNRASSTDPLSAVASSADAEAPAPAGGVRVSLVADDDTLQWLKLKDASGAQVLKASPSAETTVPAGAYVLSAKVVGRAALSAEFTVDGDSAWSCQQGEAGTVACTEAAGANLALTP